MIFRLFDIALIVAAASGIASILIVLSQRWHGKHSLDHDLCGIQKFHTTAVPRIGGVAIFCAIVFALVWGYFVAIDFFSNATMAVASLLVIAGLPAFIGGIVEDLTKKVSVKVRLLATMVSALLASALLGATIDQLNIWGVDSLLTWTPFALLITAVVVSGGVNAINIIDGFNGLAGSTVAIMLAALATVSWQVGDMLVAELALIGLGAAVGFLAVNYPTGKLFLGDGGAYFLGFWVAEVAVLLLVRNSNVNAWQILSICAYPVIEVMYSMYRRRIIRQASPGAPDGLHLHTLVYRRLVSRYFSIATGHPWKRNAAVTCVMAPWIAAAALLSVTFGRTVAGGILVVVVQVLVYLTVYARLVRGRWTIRAPESLAAERDDCEASAS